MPATIIETYRSREGSEGNRADSELRYIVRGTDDDVEVRTLLFATSPPFYLGLRRSDVNFVPVGAGIWECSVRYENQEEPQYTFDTGGGTQHVSQSLNTVGQYAAPGFTAPNFGGAIGVSEDQVVGTDIAVPIYNFTETHFIDNSIVSQAYKLTLFRLTGKVNDAPYKGYETGELLFLGASGSRRGKGDWEITFRFAASPNVTNLQLGNISGIQKEGWHYLWVRFTDDTDTGSQTLVKKPIAAYVEQVYQYADFSLLGLAS